MKLKHYFEKHPEISQKALAEKIGVSPEFVSMLAAGKRTGSIESIYSGIYYCLKLYYTPHVYALTSDNDYLLIDGTYLDSPVGSKIVINSLYYSDEFTNADNELKLNSYKIYVYDENDNLLLQGERINDKPRKINDMLMDENLVFDKRLKSNNIFDHHFKVLAIVIEYGEKETNQISCLVKVFDD